MADGTHAIPIRWLFGRSERRRRAIQCWVGDPAKGLLIAAVYEGLKALPIDACSGFGAMMAKSASRRYSELDARARENLKQIRPEDSDPSVYRCCDVSTVAIRRSGQGRVERARPVMASRANRGRTTTLRI